MNALAEVKSKLEIPEAIKDHDAAVASAITSARAFFSSETGLQFTASTGNVDTFRMVRPGRTLVLGKCPVASITELVAKGYGGSFSAYPYEIVDASHGVIAILKGGAWADPRVQATMTGGMLDLVRVTYSVSVYSPPADVEDVIHLIAAHFYRQDKAGPRTSFSAGGFSTSVSDRDLPQRARDTIRRLKPVVVRVL